MLLIRIFDFFISIFFLIIFSPIFIIILLLISLFQEGPIFFISKRVGLNGRLFYIYKFKTMKTKKTDTEPDKVTKLGNFFRRTSLDEIPQFINIVKGDMSLVGPRPLPLTIEKKIDDYNVLEKRRSVKPGITGLSQIKFRKNRTLKEKIKNDIEFVDNYSFRLYLNILSKTPKILISRYIINRNANTL